MLQEGTFTLSFVLQEYQKLFLHYENVFLGYAASSGNVEILELFLQKDDVDKLNVVCDPFGAPPLHLVVEQTVTDKTKYGVPNINKNQ
jgi:hypothetical protein